MTSLARPATPFRTLARLAVLAAVALHLGACNSMQDAKNARGAGTVRLYQQPVEKVWSVVPAAIARTDLTLVEENRAGSYYTAQRGVRPLELSHGENVAIFVGRIGENQSQVEVVSKRKDQLNITAKDYETVVLDAIGVELDRVDRQGP